MGRKQSKPRHRGRFSNTYKRKPNSAPKFMLGGGHQGKVVAKFNIQRVIHNIVKALMEPIKAPRIVARKTGDR